LYESINLECEKMKIKTKNLGKYMQLPVFSSK